MGSAQSARGIQPDGPGPSPPACACPPTRPAVPRGGRGGRGPPAGRGSTAAVGRISSAAVRRDRLRFGLEGSGGEGGSWLRPRALQRLPAPTSPLTPGPRASHLRALPNPLGDGAPPLPARLSTGPDCPQSAPDRAAPPGRGPAHATRALGVRGDAGHPTDPSCNTDQGVQRARESEGPKRNPTAQ